jgi:hypothetical protein
MRRGPAILLTVIIAILSPGARGAEADRPADIEGKAFLVLTVTADEPGLADKVRDMLRFKAKRLGAVVYDASSVAEALGTQAVPVDAPAADLAALAREKFSADVVVTAHVAGLEPYQVRVRAVHVEAPPRVFDRTYPAENHHVVAIQVAGAVYDLFGAERPDDPLRMLREDPDIARRWQSGPNLVANPGFETPAPDGRGPASWQAVETQMAWVGNPDGPGKVLKYDMDEATAGGYGLDFYSDWIPIEPGAVYRFSCRYKSLGPTPKIFLKGYHAFEAQGGYPAQRRETYRRQVHPSGEKGQWNTVTADFVPLATTAAQQPAFLKVDLYAYWPAGVILWDDVVLKKVRDAPNAPAKGATKSD